MATRRGTRTRGGRTSKTQQIATLRALLEQSIRRHSSGMVSVGGGRYERQGCAAVVGSREPCICGAREWNAKVNEALGK